jgi:putative integral membrane protein (TIGR02587 family)
MKNRARRDADRLRKSKPMRDTGRAFGGALIFSLPMLMTMEFWHLGFTIDPIRLLIYFLLAFPMLTVLSHQIGFENTPRWMDDIVDAAFALFIGAFTAFVVLVCFAVLTPEVSFREFTGKIAVETVPAAIGALLARSQFGTAREDDVKKKEETYGGEMFLMGVGALFLGLNVAPTEEVVVIAYRITPWHALALLLLSLGIVHGFVFAVGFRGGSELDPETPWWSAFLRLTLPGYILALAISFYVLWTFHNANDLPARALIFSAIVLALPSSLGAAAARLIL